MKTTLISLSTVLTLLIGVKPSLANLECGRSAYVTGNPDVEVITNFNPPDDGLPDNTCGGAGR